MIHGPIDRPSFLAPLAVLALAIVTVASGPNIATAAAPAEDTVTKAGLSLVVPPGSEITASTLDTGVEVIAITRGEEVCLVTVYPKRIRIGRALSVHVDELSRHIKKTAIADSLNVKPFKMRLFRRWRSAKLIDYKERVAGKDKRSQAHVVAGETRGRIVVVSWSAPRAGIARAFSPDLIRTLRNAKDRRKARRKSRKARRK